MTRQASKAENLKRRSSYDVGGTRVHIEKPVLRRLE
jgi:hypothetical protein